MIVLMLVIVGGLVAWGWRRAARRQELAGRLATRPTYQVEPAARRMGRFKDGLL